MSKISFTTEVGKEITGEVLYSFEASHEMIDCTRYGDQYKRYEPGLTTTKLHVYLSEKSSEILNYLMESFYQSRKINIKLDNEVNIIRGYGSVMELKYQNEESHFIFLLDSLEFESCVE